MPNVLILILNTRDSSYAGFVKACKNTWVARAQQFGLPCIFYHGGESNDILEQNELKLAVDDSLDGTALKLYRALEYIDTAGIEYDYIFRTNLSSFIYTENLVKWINTITDEDLYAGVIVHANLNDRWPYRFMRRLAERFRPKNTVPFASGAGFWLSKSNVKRILSDTYLDFKLADDAMIGECLFRHGINITPVSRIDFNDNAVRYFAGSSDKLSDIVNCFHIRCKSENRVRDCARFCELIKCTNPSDFSKLHIN